MKRTALVTGVEGFIALEISLDQADLRVESCEISSDCFPTAQDSLDEGLGGRILHVAKQFRHSDQYPFQGLYAPENLSTIHFPQICCHLFL